MRLVNVHEPRFMMDEKNDFEYQERFQHTIFQKERTDEYRLLSEPFIGALCQ